MQGNPIKHARLPLSAPLCALALAVAALLTAGCAGDPTDASLLPGGEPLVLGIQETDGLGGWDSEIVAIAVEVPRPGTVTALGFVHAFISAGGHGELGLFAADGSGNLTGTPLGTTGDQSFPAAAAQPSSVEYPVSIPVPAAGTYWIALAPISTTVDIGSNSSAPNAHCTAGEVVLADGVTGCTQGLEDPMALFLRLE